MKTFAAVAAFGAVASATMMTKTDYDFMRWISKHNKMYETVEEFKMRQEIWSALDAEIERMNNKKTLATFGHNHMSDWTDGERSKILGLLNMPMEEEWRIPEDQEIADVANLAESWDWRDHGAVTPVKDQGQCGSCWAFSSIEAVESAWIIAGNEMAIMSPQELVDCTLSPVTQNNGCGGGWYFWSYDWLADNMTMLESDYPYTSGTSGTETACAYDAAKGVTNVSSYGRTWGANNNLARLAQQPVNVAVSAGNAVFGTYTSGIITGADNCPQAIDHAIVAVGWGEENGVQYYIVRNSWGTSWGEDGYIRLATHDESESIVTEARGICGVNQYVYYPSV